MKIANNIFVKTSFLSNARFFALGWMLFQLSANQNLVAEGWIFPPRSLQGRSGADEKFVSDQKLNALIRDVTSRNYEFRLTLPAVDFSSHEVGVYSVIETTDGEYRREVVIFTKDKVGDWVVANKEIAALNTENAVNAHAQLKKFIMGVRYSYDGMMWGLGGTVGLWECELRPDQDFVVQAMVFSLPSDPKVFGQYRKILDVVMGEIPTPPK